MMNNKIYLLFLGLIFLASCGSGLSEKEKNEIENFEKEWDVNIQMGKLLSDKLDIAEKLIFVPLDTTIQDSIAPTSTNFEKYEKEYKIIEKKYDLFNLNLNKEYSSWMEFKNSAMNAKIEYEEVISFLESKRKIMLKFQTDISKLIKQADKLLSEIQSK